MAQPIIIDNAGRELKMREQMFRAQLFDKAFAEVAGAVSNYVETKKKQDTEKFTSMTALAAQYGAKQLGPTFQNEFGQMLAKRGIDIPKNEAGLYEIPETFEDKMRAEVMKRPELIPVMLGLQKPPPSPEEQHWKEQELQIKKDATRGRIRAAEISAGSRLEAARIGAGSRLEAAKIAGGTRIETAKIAASSKPTSYPSGYYNFQGKLIPATKIAKDPERFKVGQPGGAYELNMGLYDMMVKSDHIRKMDADRAQRVQMLSTKMQQDAANAELKPFVQVIGAAAKSKDTKVQRRLMSELVTRLNDIEGLGMSNEDIASLIDDKWTLGHFLDIFRTSSVLTATDVQTPAKKTGPQTTSTKLDDGTEVHIMVHPDEGEDEGTD